MKKLYLLFLIILPVFSNPAFSEEWVYPVGDPNTNTMRITQEYMEFYSGNNKYHVGTDIGRGREGNREFTPDNKTIRAVADGRVIYVRTGYNGGWGNTIVLRHDFLDSRRYIFTSYSHLAENSLQVAEGNKVQSGQPIATMGRTGATDVHLHFMVFSKNNGSDLWDNFSTADLGTGYISSPVADRPYVDSSNRAFYNPLLFLDFARLATISPISIKEYSVNLDATSSLPSELTVGRNTVDITVATYRHDVSMYFALRNYNGGPISGNMLEISRGDGGWIMDGKYNPLGDDTNNNGWNREYTIKYSYSFDLSQPDDKADMAVFWKPKNYDSLQLILPIPGGNAHNTITNSGRYVTRPVR